MYIVIASSGAAHARLGSDMKEKEKENGNGRNESGYGENSRCSNGNAAQSRYHVNDGCRGLRWAMEVLRIEAKIESS
jgi:hypothetical protein